MSRNELKHDVILGFLCVLVFITSFAAVIKNAEKASAEEAAPLKYYLGSVVNTGNDNGYTEETALKENDPHYGWTLGRFFVSGHTRVTEADTPVFLKTVGDRVTLWFALDENIDKLNGNENLIISEDKNGYDTYFGVEKQNFGRGTLIVRHTDYQNASDDPVVYTNYLQANAVAGEEIKVELFEEGDYEIALDYEIKDNSCNIFGFSIAPSYNNYRIFFRFSVRNGNCMVYPFDTVTGAELVNSAITENGFYLDLAKSRYLDIDIKKEVLIDGADGLTEDVRFNNPAKDGGQYIEEGVYTITVSNRYTNQQTIKKIYVGGDDVLKAHVATGFSIQEIKHQVAVGATINDDGTMNEPPEESLEDSPEQDESSEKTEEEHAPNIWLFTALGSVVTIFLIVLFLVLKKRRARQAHILFDSEDDTLREKEE